MTFNLTITKIYLTHNKNNLNIIQGDSNLRDLKELPVRDSIK